MPQNHFGENTPDYAGQAGQSGKKLETLKYHLTCAAEISEEAGLYVKTAEIKQVNADICRMQGKDEDADKLEHTISGLRNKTRVKNMH